MKKRIVLCADDYGQGESISRGILNLLQKKRLSAVSCMTNMPLWALHASWLQPFKEQADIGLHFNLTEGAPLSAAFKQTYGDTLLPLPQLLLRAFSGALKRASVEAECHAQLDQFEAAFGSRAAYVDGHQHVHQFPIIREALINVYKARLGRGVWIRLVKQSLQLQDLYKSPKKVLIQALGTRSFERLLQQNQIPHNTSFSGVYSFSRSLFYKDFFPLFLQETAENGLIMCHPATGSNSSRDRIAAARCVEYDYLASDQFLQDCELAGVVLSPLRLFS